MRIALISHSDAPWTPFYARHFRQRGHDLLVISFHPKLIAGIEVNYLGARSADGRLPKWVYLKRIPMVRRLLREWRPDVVLAPYLRSNGLVATLTKCSALVVSCRGTDVGRGLRGVLDQPLARWMGGHAELVHASSPELAERLIAWGIKPDKIVVIPLGTDPAQFPPRVVPRAPGPVRILCTRKHFRIYDNDTLVRAFALLDRERFEFECRFAGNGPTLEATRRLARGLGIEPRVHFLGDVEHAEMPPLLAWADLYVSAARSDGAPSSLFEAMSAGVFPVVADIRANRDWLDPGRTGYLCHVGSAEEWARGIRETWENPTLRAEAAAVNRLVIERKCNRAAGLEALEEALNRAVALYRGRAGSD